MSITEQVSEVGVDQDLEELVDSIVRGTVPGESNEKFNDGIDNASDIVPVVMDDLNNWFEIVEVRVINRDHISIPMRYRWTIIKWSNSDMDQWLIDRDWDLIHHRNADTRFREENELEARYRKEFDGITVDANFLVEFPDIVFRKINGDDISRVKEKVEKEEEKESRLRKLINIRRDK